MTSSTKSQKTTDPLRDVGHAYARKLAAAGNDLTYVHNPNLTHGFPQFTRSSAACHQATLELADLIKTKIGCPNRDLTRACLGHRCSEATARRGRHRRQP